jgi:general secretion pathway protein D
MKRLKSYIRTKCVWNSGLRIAGLLLFGITSLMPIYAFGDNLSVRPIHIAQAPGTPAPATPGATPAPTPSAVQGTEHASNSDHGSSDNMVTMDFRNADIANVLKFFALATNWQIVPDPGLTGTVTIISPKQLTIDQAFEVLQSTLEVRGFSGQLQKHGDTTILQIVPLARAVQSTPLLKTSPTKPSDVQNQVITQVIPIQNVDATTLSKELTPLMSVGASIVASSGTNALIVTDIATNVQRISDLVGLLDQTASNDQFKMFALANADATTVASTLTDLFKQLSNRGIAQPAAPGQPQPPQGRPGAPQNAATANRGAIVAVADARTNSVLVVASKDNMQKAEDIIKKLDNPDALAQSTKMVKLKYADAQQTADTINSVITSSSSSSSQQNFGGSPFAMRVFGRFFGQQNNQNNQQSDIFSKVVADQRTNSLIITATPERMARIDTLISQLDVDVPIEVTTDVIQLQNTQANDIATALGSALGMSNTQNYNRGNTSSQNISLFGNQNSNSNSRINRNNGRSVPLTRAAAIPGMGYNPSTGLPVSANDPAGIPGTLTDQGFVPDSQSAADPQGVTRQYNPYQNRANNNSSTSSGAVTYGLGQGGRYTGLLQLPNNVTVIPEPNTNTLLVNGTPAEIQAIKEIVAKLDVAPQQVLIEVIIAEASLDATQKLGFQFDGSGIGRLLGKPITEHGSSSMSINGGTVAANIASPISPGFQYGIQALNGSFDALLQALKTDNNVKIISTPKIFTSNNQEANIQITTNVPYVTSSYSGLLNSGGSNVSYGFLPVGVELDVTPKITRSGLVTIDVVASDSELLGFTTLSSGLNSAGQLATIQAPETAQRSTDTSVVCKDNEMVALGGLMSNSKTIQTNKVPLLGDLPFIGNLFRNTTTTTSKSELMIFMVPHVVQSDSQIHDLLNKQSQGLTKTFPEIKKMAPNSFPETPPTNKK